MRILDETNDRSIKQVTLFLTPDEASSLNEQLKGLISNPKSHHIHVEDANSEREITLTVYTSANLSEFDERSKKIIEKDE